MSKQLQVQEILNRVFDSTNNKLNTSGEVDATVNQQLNDNVKLLLGTGSDVEHYYDATNYQTKVNAGDWILTIAGGNVYPATDGGIILGSTNKRFSNLYLTTAAYIGDSTHGQLTQGLVINQEANDNLILALKSSDVATGLTTAPFIGTLETDDIFAVQKRSATLGGVVTHMVAEDDNLGQIWWAGFWGGQAGTAKTQADGQGLVHFAVAEHDGANSLANITADGNVFSVAAQVGGSNKVRFMVDEDGEGHFANTTLVTLSDDVPDAIYQRGGRILAGAPSPFLEEMWSGIQQETGMTKREMARWFEDRKIMHFEWDENGEPLPNGGMTSVRNGLYFAWDGLWQAHEERRALWAEMEQVKSKLEIAERQIAAIGGR